MGERVCPRCNRKPDIPFIRGICARCYVEREIKLQQRVVVPHCPLCNRYMLSGRWSQYSMKEVLKSVALKLQRELERLFRGYDVYIKLDVDDGGEFTAVISDSHSSFRWRPDALLEVKHQICPDCSRKIVGHHAAIIQVRGIGGPLSRSEKESILELLDRLPQKVKGSIVEVKEVKEGIDIKVSEHSTARSIASRILAECPGTLKESYKLISRSGGEKKTRLNLSVRVSKPVKKKALVEYQGELAIAEWKAGGRVELQLIPSNKRILLDARESVSRIREYTGELEEVEIIGVSTDRVFFIKRGELEYDEVDLKSVIGAPEKGKKAFVVIVGGRRLLAILD
uniref:Nmd3 N-terminal domain-containing protein n=1 Tax=Fervidicoccus fontis TaxID=683846 RepID=A0A7J3ZM09_9CREN